MRAVPNLISVSARKPSVLRLRYSDGIAGDVDLSDLVGEGVFEPLRDPEVFEGVSITSEGQISWSEEMEICADSLYLEITGTSLADLAVEAEERDA